MLELLESLIKRWNNVEQDVTIFGQTLKCKPAYISILYKEMLSKSVLLINGEQLEMPIKDDNGFYLDVFIGEPSHGLGRSHGFRAHIPRGGNAIRDSIDQVMDDALKVALQSYLNGVASKVTLNAPTFFGLSDDRVEKYSGKLQICEEIPSKIHTLLKSFATNISAREWVDKNQIAVISNSFKYYFCDSQGRRIESSNHSKSVSGLTHITHTSGIKLELSDSVLNWSINDITELMGNHIRSIGELHDQELAESGEYPAIFLGGAVGTTVHEALGGHLLSARYIANGESTLFKHKIGEKILPEFITIIDDPTLKDGYGSFEFDDQGIRAQRVILVKNGVLQNFLSDRVSAWLLGKQSNGRARIQDVYTWNEDSEIDGTEPRVSNLILKSTKTFSQEELENLMIAECKRKGLKYGYIVDGNAGQVNPTTGEFNLVPNRAWRLYTNGKRKSAGQFAVLGHPYNMLKNIKATGRNYIVSSGHCGAGSGYVPTMEIAPAAYMSNVNIVAISTTKYQNRLLDKQK